MVNWKKILTDGSDNTVYMFATGQLAAKKACCELTGTPGSSEFRNLLKTRGTNDARVLARKALRRRGYTI
jgi:hypothetical protein